MRKQFITGGAVIGAALAATAASFVVANPAYAALTTICTGTASDASVPGDLVVPKGKSCTLDKVTVKGAVRVNEGANLVVKNSEFNSTVGVSRGGYVDLINTKVGGNITSTGSFGVYLESVQLTGSYSGRTVAGAEPGFYYLIESQQTAGISATNGETVLEGSTVGGNVVSRGADYLDIYDSVVKRNVTNTNSASGGVVCDSEVYGTAAYDGNGLNVQMGGVSDLAECSGSNFFAKDVTVSNTKGQVLVSDNIISGKLSGTGNDPAPLGEGNRVRGGAEGQFADLQAPPAREGQQPMSAGAGDRTEATKAAALDRRAKASAAAEAAGEAF